MEQLLVHCATAIQQNDVALCHQILRVLSNLAPPDGDSDQRLTSAFLRALIIRATNSGAADSVLTSLCLRAFPVVNHRFNAVDLAGYLDMTPWHRFGFTASNAAVVDSIEGFASVHIVDLSLTHCMQLPTLLDAISSKLEFPPIIKITMVSPREELPPLLDQSYDELGLKIVNFGRSKKLIVDFEVIDSCYADGFSSLVHHLREHRLAYGGGEALIVNCQMSLHYIPDESLLLEESSPTYFSFPPYIESSRSMFLKTIRSLNPTIVIIIEEDADLTSNDLECRLRSAYNFLWIHYDTVDTFLPKGTKQREWFEADMSWKIENVIAYEGLQRVERLEPRRRWVQRMRDAGFSAVTFKEDATSEIKNLLEEHATGWGLKKEDDNLVLTWKGNNAIFAAAWMPS